MLTYLSKHKIYEVEDIDKIIENVKSFLIVSKLPDLDSAKDNIIYYLRTSRFDTGPNGKLIKVLKPYVVGLVSDKSDERAWYTSSSGGSSSEGGVTSYPLLDALPSINGEKFIGELSDKADLPVSESGIDGGYDMCIQDEDIKEIVANVMDITTGRIGR